MGGSLNYSNLVNRLAFQKKTRVIMKTAILATAGLGLANASMKSILGNVENYQRRMANRTNRAFQGVTASVFEPINGYGCWCYLDDQWRDENQVLINRPAILAHGKVVDNMDETCRDLINSYKCIEMDAEAEGINDCDAQAVPYVAFGFEAGRDLEADCQADNAGDNCAINACIVEATFTFKFIDYMGFTSPSITTHEDYDAQYVHTSKGGTFDPEVSCPGIPNPVGSPKECCGDFAQLTRHPFRLQTGFTTRSCCAGEVINNEISQCCNGAAIDFSDACV